MKILFLLKKASTTLLTAFTDPLSYTFSGFLIILQALAGMFLSGIIPFIEKYIFSDWTYATSLAIACVLNIFSGVYISLRIKPVTFQWKILRLGVLDKLVLYPIVLACLSLLNKARINSAEVGIWDFVYFGAAGVVLSIEVGSTIGNCSKIFPFLDSIFERLNIVQKQFIDNPQEKPTE